MVQKLKIALFLALFFLSTIFGQVVPYDEPFFLTHKPDQTPRFNFKSSPFNVLIENSSYSKANSDGIRHLIKLENIETPKYYIEVESLDINTNQKLFVMDEKSNAFWGPFYFINKSIKIGPFNKRNIYIEILTDKASSTKIKQIIPYKNFKGSTDGIDYHNKRESSTILITGYWPPTNEMIRHFSQNPELNPDGWQGENWENSGYDIVSFFPSFNNPDCSQCGQGYGDLEVDYQDTSEDFWPIVNQIKPTAIITFSRGYIDNSWEVEFNYYNRMNWYQDYQYPYIPTPNPPDQDESAYSLRNSSLPMQEIVYNITNNLPQLSLNPYIDWDDDPGQFVSEFMGYHGVWYRDTNLHGDFPCYIAGHVHVGGLIETPDARLAAEETVRTIINYLNNFSYSLGDPNSDGIIDVLDLILVINNILGETEFSNTQFYSSDINLDGIINIQDIIQLINIILQN